MAEVKPLLDGPGLDWITCAVTAQHVAEFVPATLYGFLHTGPEVRAVRQVIVARECGPRTGDVPLLVDVLDYLTRISGHRQAPPSRIVDKSNVHKIVLAVIAVANESIA